MMFFSKIYFNKILITSFILILSMLFLTSNINSKEFVLVDDFETHQWKHAGWGDDTGSASYSTDWSPQGDYSLKLYTSYAGSGWNAYITNYFEAIQPDYIRFDFKAVSASSLDIKCLDTNGVERLLSTATLSIGETTNYTVTNTNNYTIKQLRFIIFSYNSGQSRTIYVDNIRMDTGSGYELWDPCEDHPYWNGKCDADNGDVNRIEDLSHSIYSDNNSSTASLVMEWDSTVSASNNGEIEASLGGMDWEAYNDFKFDVYRPNATSSSVEIRVFIWDGDNEEGSSTYCVKVTNADEWITVTLPMENVFDQSNITHIKFTVYDTSIVTSGKIYFDNLYVGVLSPETSEVDPDNLTGVYSDLYTHFVKNYSDGISGNEFDGGTGVGTNGVSISQELSYSVKKTKVALKLNYDLSTTNSYGFYYNTLFKNTIKSKLVLYMRGGFNTANGYPEKIKLDIKDANGTVSCFLSDIDPANWKQWVIDLETELSGTIDLEDIREIVVVIEGNKIQNPIGALYIDDIFFLDASDDTIDFSPAYGTKYPETTPVDPDTYASSNGLYKHMIKDWEDGLSGNDFDGVNGVGGQHESSTEQELSTNESYSGDALELVYDMTADGDYGFYYNTFQKNSSKEKLIVYMKGQNSAKSPANVKIEVKSGENNSNVAIRYLGGISSSEWKQWIVDLSEDLIGKIDKDDIREVTFVFDYAGVGANKSGSLYIDNLMFLDESSDFTSFPGAYGNIYPETTMIDPDNLTGQYFDLWKHTLKDWSDGLSGNEFYGFNGVGSSLEASCDQYLSTTEYKTADAMKIDFKVSNSAGFWWYYNTLNVNSDKSHLVIHLKGGSGTDNPGAVRLEIKDSLNVKTRLLGGISSTEWKQWIIDLSNDLGGEIDLNDIREVVFSLDNRICQGDKEGLLYIDDIIFLDKTDTLTFFPDFNAPILPEDQEIDPDNLTGEYSGLYKHTLKDWSDGLPSNDFAGSNGVGSTTNASCTQTLSTTDYKTSDAMKIEYDLSNSGSFFYYYNTLNKDSDKSHLIVYLKGGSGTDNPDRVKLEIKDTNYNVATAILDDISDTQWQQWIIDLSEDLTGTVDLDSVKEVVFSLDNNNCGGDKAGYFYIDDVIFLDSTNNFEYYPGIVGPLDTTKDVVTEGVRYLIDDFDQRIIADGSTDLNWEDELFDKGQEMAFGFNEFCGYTGAGGGGPIGETTPDVSFSISSTEIGEIAHSIPFARRVDYDFKDGEGTYVFYYNTLSNKHYNRFADLTFADYVSLWLRGGGTNNNPGEVKLEFHDDQWGVVPHSGLATITLKDISDDEWAQYWINPSEASIFGETFHWDAVSEVTFVLGENTVTDKSGTLYIDDIMLMDTDQKFVEDSDFDLTADSEFLDLVIERTFNYFLQTSDPTSGMFTDRVHFPDLSSIAAIGFAFTGLVIGVENGWCTSSYAEDVINKCLDTLLDPDLKATSWDQTQDVNRYRGFYYHFLDTWEGTRKGTTELSIIDTALLLCGALTAKEYFSTNTDIVDKVDQMYDAVEWDWYLDLRETVDDETNCSYNEFYMGWNPDYVTDPSDDNTGFAGHWDVCTDETLLIVLLAIGSSTHDVSPDVFTSFKRVEDATHDFIMSWSGSQFNNFFAHCWMDLYGNNDYRDQGSYGGMTPGNLYDEHGINWWDNAVTATLRNRAYCIEGVDGLGREDVSTYHSKSWGLASCGGIPKGVHNTYIGENGSRPNVHFDFYGGFGDGEWSNINADGTVPPYAGISNILFSAYPNQFPISYIQDIMQYYYQETQLWGGYFGFRDAYTDADRLKPYMCWDSSTDTICEMTADSLYPVYSGAYFAIDQGPMLIGMENYRSGLIWEYFMQNQTVKNAMAKIFTGNIKLNRVIVQNGRRFFWDTELYNNEKYIIQQSKDFNALGYIEVTRMTIAGTVTVGLTAGAGEYIKLGPGFIKKTGTTFSAGVSN